LRIELDKQSIIKYLFVTAIVLMFFRFGVDHFIKAKPADDYSITKPAEIDSLLLNTFSAYGIEPGWIKKIPHGKLNPDTTEYFKVQVPSDLPIPVLLNGIGRNLALKNIDVSSKELEVNGHTVLSLIAGKRTVCHAEFIVDKLLIRKAADFGLILNKFYELSDKESAGMLSIPEKFAAVLIPSPASEKMKDSITNYEKEYVILINDNIDEPKYKIESDFESRRIKNAVSEIIGTFSNAKLFLIDDGSKLYKSDAGNLIFNEFKKRKITLSRLSDFTYLHEHDGQDIQYYFRRLCESNTGSEKKVVIINAEDFGSLLHEIELFRNRGYKFVLPSVLNL
jgi:hypothetical protein